MDYSYLDLNHLDSILKIEQESNPYPWTEVNFKDCLEKGYYSLALEEEKKTNWLCHNGYFDRGISFT